MTAKRPRTIKRKTANPSNTIPVAAVASVKIWLEGFELGHGGQRKSPVCTGLGVLERAGAGRSEANTESRLPCGALSKLCENGENLPEKGAKDPGSRI
jgi:hypothetical protein